MGNKGKSGEQRVTRTGISFTIILICRHSLKRLCLKYFQPRLPGILRGYRRRVNL